VTSSLVARSQTSAEHAASDSSALGEASYQTARALLRTSRAGVEWPQVYAPHSPVGRALPRFRWAARRSGRTPGIRRLSGFAAYWMELITQSAGPTHSHCVSPLTTRAAPLPPGSRNGRHRSPNASQMLRDLFVGDISNYNTATKSPE
jgi:hypothetical protein